MKSSQESVAGIYVTDDYIDVAVGQVRLDTTDSVTEPFDVSLVDFHTKLFREHTATDGRSSVQTTFDAVVDWIAKRSPQTRKIGVGCFGPFQSLDWRMPAAQRIEKGYGRISSSVHARLEHQNVYELITNAFARAGQPVPDIQIQTDVEVAALGELYSRYVENGRWVKGGKKQVIAFLKFSKGIGGGVVYGDRLWAGRLHAEMGQIRVERWPGINETTREDEASLNYSLGCAIWLADVD